MKNLLRKFRVKSEPNQLFDMVLSLLEKQDLKTMRKISDGDYVAGDANITIKYFDSDAFDEMQISFGYSFGKGITVVLRNYVEHLVVINHEIMDSYETIEFPIKPDSFTIREYRERFDAIAEAVFIASEMLND